MSASQALNAVDSVNVADALPGWVVKAGGFVFGAAGFFTAGAGLQLLAFLEPTWTVILSSALLMTLGAVACLVAPNVILGRSWAAILGVPVVLTMALVMLVWGAWSSVMLFLSPLTLLAMATSMLAAAVVPFTVPGSLRATRARNALYA
jgi:hypothetical protein